MVKKVNGVVAKNDPTHGSKNSKVYCQKKRVIVQKI